MNITFYTALLNQHQNVMNLIILFLFRLSGDNVSLNGSYRQNSEFFKKDSGGRTGSQDKECERGSIAPTVTPTKPMTWDTLKKIRRQKSWRGTSELKKYQSSVCLLEPRCVSLQTEAEEKSFSLNEFLKYEDVYRSSPALRSVNSFVCHDEPGRQRRNNNNLTFSKQFSASALKFTG